VDRDRRSGVDRRKKRNGRHDRADLKAIARRAMIDRGLEPGFSRDVLSELEALRGAAPVGRDGVRDMRERLWV